MKKLLCLLLCGLLLVGCARKPEAYIPTGNGLTWDEESPNPTEPLPTESEQAPLVLTYYPKVTMNPYECTDFTNRALFSLLYQGLFTVDRDYKVEPVLCKQYRVSEDMKTYTFYLEKAAFSDGEVLAPEDAVASLKAASESPYYGGRFQHVSDIALSDDGGVTIQLRTPYENLPILLDVPIVKEEEVGAMRPLGTGPYYYREIATSAELLRHKHWWCKGELAIQPNQIPLLRAQSVTQIRDAFEFEGLSLVCADPGSDRYADYRCDFELWDCENGEFLYLTTSKASKVFSDPQVSANLTHVIDRDLLVDELYRGFARSAALPAAPQSPYYSQALADKYGLDAVKFSEAVKNAGFQGEKIILLVNGGDSLRVRSARAIKKMLEECGLEVELSTPTGSNYHMMLKQWNFDLHLGQTKLSPNMDLTQFFSENGVLSWGAVNDPAIYALCQQALENHGNYYTLHKTIMEQGRLVPVLFGSYAVFATRGMVTNLTPARDNIFWYSVGKSMEQALIQDAVIAPTETTALETAP